MARKIIGYDSLGRAIVLTNGSIILEKSTTSDPLVGINAIGEEKSTFRGEAAISCITVYEGTTAAENIGGILDACENVIFAPAGKPNYYIKRNGVML